MGSWLKFLSRGFDAQQSMAPPLSENLRDFPLKKKSAIYSFGGAWDLMPPSQLSRVLTSARSICLRVSGAVAPSALTCIKSVSPATMLPMIVRSFTASTRAHQMVTSIYISSFGRIPFAALKAESLPSFRSPLLHPNDQLGYSPKCSQSAFFAQIERHFPKGPPLEKPSLW